MRLTRLSLAALALAALAGCDALSGNKTPTRNFNELIPRFMNAANKATPEEAAANLFNVTSPDERRDAVAYLEIKPYGHEPPYMRAYEVLTTDPHPMVRSQAMVALGTSHQASAVSYLIKGLNDPNENVRRDAATGLLLTFSPDATKSLIEHVRSDVDTQVRINCARALGNATTPDAIRALIDAVDDKDAAVAFTAHRSLVSITREDYGYDTKAWLTSYQETYAPAPAPGIAPPVPPSAPIR